ncbi:MAG: ABC transporter ATP-binding protein [Candidatus Heimdallarchaeota archaeon]|nr:ABC transporter ATP-binding protein [Candidatus Heimdallarchaeota archaeon]MCK5048025.1 ABC transporter ATP-binding protein [Candidatus Heimdallarchaeota archaeon]
MSEAVISISNLSKTYPNGFEAVKNISLDIYKGEIFGLLGPNGAGKTTSIKCITNLLKPTSGSIKIFGKDPSDKSLKNLVGVVPQHLVFWPTLTCEENLRLIGRLYDLSSSEIKDRIDQLLSDLQLEDKRKEFAQNLSGGMKRRLNLAMSIIHEPEIIVCDEPSPGMDPQSRRVLWDYLNSISKDKGKTVILTTHLMEEADLLSDRVAIIDHGKLLIIDEPEKLKDKHGSGDVLEILIEDDPTDDIPPEESLEMVRSKIAQIKGITDCKIIDNFILVNALNITNHMKEVISITDSLPVRVQNFSLRRNTLEDVFITLTGRALRED